MEQWQDQGIVLNARRHGEGGAIVSLLTENNGRHAGYVHGATSSKKKTMLEPGATVSVQWQARVSDSLGTFQMELEYGTPVDIMGDPLKLAALLSACTLCHDALPEREGHGGLYHGMHALMSAMENDHWGAAYVMWEIQLLRELGFPLTLDQCAGGGDPQTLSYISPKTGRAVSKAQAAPYKEKLLPLPNFLRPEGAREGEAATDEDVLTGLRMNAYFLEHWAFIHHTKGLPMARVNFEGLWESKV